MTLMRPPLLSHFFFSSSVETIAFALILIILVTHNAGPKTNIYGM
jgi:hypothetical protein